MRSAGLLSVTSLWSRSVSSLDGAVAGALCVLSRPQLSLALLLPPPTRQLSATAGTAIAAAASVSASTSATAAPASEAALYEISLNDASLEELCTYLGWDGDAGVFATRLAAGLREPRGPCAPVLRLDATSSSGTWPDNVVVEVTLATHVGGVVAVAPLRMRCGARLAEGCLPLALLSAALAPALVPTSTEEAETSAANAAPPAMPRTRAVLDVSLAAAALPALSAQRFKGYKGGKTTVAAITGAGAVTAATVAEHAAVVPAPSMKRKRSGESTRVIQSLASSGAVVPTVSPSIADELTVVDLGDGVVVSAVGLGTLPLGVSYPDPAKVPDAAGARAVQAAAVAAASPARLFVDLADTYCTPFTALRALERVLSAGVDALAKPPVLTSKAGMVRVSDASSGWRPAKVTPASVRSSILASREACGCGDRPLFLWSLHHADALKAPGAIEAALAAAAACVREGVLSHVGLCNATPDLIRRALAVTPLLCVQNEWSPWARTAERPEGAVAAAGTLALCAARGVVFVAYGALGGLKARTGERDAAANEAIARVAAARGASPSAVVLAALLHRGRALGARVIVLAGARTVAHASDSGRHGARLRLSDADVDAVLPPMSS